MSHVFDKVIKNELIGFLEGVESKVIKNKEVVSGDVVEFFEVGTIGLVIEELGEEFSGGCKEYFEAFYTGGVTQCCGQKRFTDPGWTSDEDVFASLNKIAGGQLEDIGSIESLPIGVKVDLFEGSILSESGLGEEVLTPPIVSIFPFSLDDGGQDFVWT